MPLLVSARGAVRALTVCCACCRMHRGQPHACGDVPVAQVRPGTRRALSIIPVHSLAPRSPHLTPLLTTYTPPSSIFLSNHHPLSLPHAHTRHYQLGSEEQALAYLRKMICAIKEDRDPGVQVLLAISLWACPDVKTPFAVLCRDALQSEVRTMGSKQQINAWASDNTNGMIKEILSHDVCVHKYTRHTHAPTHTHTHTHAHTHTCSHTHAH